MSGGTGSLSNFSLVSGALRGLFRRGEGDVLPATMLERDGVVLDAETVASYARLCGFGPGHGVPLTYPHILAFPLHMRIMLAPDFPFPVVGLVHLHNRIRQYAALNMGDQVTVLARTGRLLAHDRGQAFMLESAVVRDGLTAWRGESVYLRLGRPGRGDPAPAVGGAVVDEMIETWSVPGDIGRRYARLSGDANPIHTSALAARLFGFRRAIAHGMWTKARAVAALMPRRSFDKAEVEVAFRAPLFLPGRARLHAGPDGRERHFELDDASGARTHLRGRLVL